MDRHPGLSGVLPEALDAAALGGLALHRSGALGHGRGLQGADDDDLVAVDADLWRTREPVIGQTAGEPAAGLFY
jgi:hypothetical protein